ncbi:PH domain-containing protein [Antiquaquibacter oligotrophicus]|uniref:PH domain-containing protein n=1 Tax=Antiquaquibacter oligotrophicus TaxID=2880260 RepID=UPI002AC93D3A|nr:cysteine-rich outer membrane protein [Antiquaquibacter oligotrophicus]UDF14407.1 PH domain-containing protein [Antiquaquibacter oligotrophicus]
MPDTNPLAASNRLADGEWHRLHPATPLLRGGIAFVAILGIIIVNLRDLVIEIVFGGPDFGDDYNPVTYIIEHEYLGLIVLAIIVGLALTIFGFWLSWRMHTFRITDELVEVRSGILFRTHRRGRLDRIQGINIMRPFLARLVGAAKLEVNVAGQDANIPLAYLGSAAADDLRREILLLASGSRADDAAPAPAVGSGSLVSDRVNELLAPELDPSLAAPESVVKMHPGRLLASLVLNLGTIIVVAAIVLVIVFASNLGSGFFIFGLIPAIIGVGSFVISRFTRSLRYSIASTPDGVRVGFGLLSTSNDTLPPGRIHAIQVSQPLLWRLTGWWEIKINRASSSSAQGAAGQANTTILPVGTLADVRKVLELVLPTMAEEIDGLERALVSRGGDEFTTSPRRAAVVRWFSWRRNGYAQTSGAVLLRRGAIWRDLVIVPKARIQSLAISRGPLGRRLRIATLRVHTVAGPVQTYVGAIDQDQAVTGFEELSRGVVAAMQSDRTHRWRGEATP